MSKILLQHVLWIHCGARGGQEKQAFERQSDYEEAVGCIFSQPGGLPVSLKSLAELVRNASRLLSRWQILDSSFSIPPCR